MTKSTKGLSPATTDIDRIVATYAPRGEMRRLRRRQRRTVVAGGCAVIACGCAFLAVSDVSLVDRIGHLMPPAAQALGRIDNDRLNSDGNEFSAKILQLEQQIADMQTHKQELESQRARLSEQGALLAQLLNEASQKQSDLEKSQQQGSQLDREISAIAAQRQALEKRWTQFEAQGELLAMEIIAVNAQRKELESQRRLIDRQQQELAELIERADGLYRRDAGSDDTKEAGDTTTTAAFDSALSADPNGLFVVDNGELDDMRGGFSVGDGLDISFGFSQTGTVNGVEQFRNSFSVDSLASGFENVDMSNMNSVLLQNGPGNFVSSGVLDALSSNFGSVIQNTLDEQVISTTTIFDISLHNLPGTVQGMHGEQALMDSLGSF